MAQELAFGPRDDGMEEDVQVQVEKLKQSLEVADLIESERSGKPRRKRKNLSWI